MWGCNRDGQEITGGAPVIEPVGDPDMSVQVRHRTDQKSARRQAAADERYVPHWNIGATRLTRSNGFFCDHPKIIFPQSTAEPWRSRTASRSYRRRSTTTRSFCTPLAQHTHYVRPLSLVTRERVSSTANTTAAREISAVLFPSIPHNSCSSYHLHSTSSTTAAAPI